MIRYIQGDIFDSPAQVIVNPVNTVGVMGKGLALSYKKRYPDMFAAYRTACEKNEFKIGNLMLWYAPDHWILLFPTKENWRNPSKIEYIEVGLKKFIRAYADKRITSIAFPRLGCGNGELSWNSVKPLMEKYLKQLPIDVYIYLGTNPELGFEPEHKATKKTMDWLKDYAKDLSFNGVKDDIKYNTAMTPYEFLAGTCPWEVTWDKGLRFLCSKDKKEICVNEEDFFAIWDDIRNKSVFQTPQDDQKRILIYAMLDALGYLSEIKLNVNDIMMDGYQLSEGAGRLFSLKRKPDEIRRDN